MAATALRSIANAEAVGPDAHHTRKLLKIIFEESKRVKGIPKKSMDGRYYYFKVLEKG